MRRSTPKQSPFAFAISVKVIGWCRSSAPDPQNSGELAWSMTAGFGDIAPGLHDLLFAAIDSAGNSSAQFPLQVCVARPFPTIRTAATQNQAPSSGALAGMGHRRRPRPARSSLPTARWSAGRHSRQWSLGDGGNSESSLKATTPGSSIVTPMAGAASGGARREHTPGKAPHWRGNYQSSSTCSTPVGKARPASVPRVHRENLADGHAPVD